MTNFLEKSKSNTAECVYSENNLKDDEFQPTVLKDGKENGELRDDEVLVACV